MPLIKFRRLKELEQHERQEIIFRSSLSMDDVVRDVIVPLYEDIKSSPLESLKKYSEKWDGFIPEPLLLEKEVLKKSYESLKKNEPETIEAFQKAYQNIKAFHEKQKPRGFETQLEDNTLGYLFKPFNSAALYVPGGKALYPSTVLMGIVPAKIAGVSEITILSPPHPQDQSVPQVVRAMAYLAGADRLLQAGGGQAILSMAVGLSELGIQPVDFIYGPGNKYVSAGKSFVSSQGLCGIDTFAGPSEVVIISDGSANPEYLAHDLLSQAEHDEDATAILICTDQNVVEKTIHEIDAAIENRDSDRKEITRASIQKNGHAFLVDDLDEAVRFSNEFAPEHLEIQTKNDDEVLSKIEAAGSVFLGEFSPVAMGDYYSGTNHILPTNRAARFSSGISTHSFFRRITYQKCSKKGIQKAMKPISTMSRVEGLFDEHGYSVLVRQ